MSERHHQADVTLLDRGHRRARTQHAYDADVDEDDTVIAALPADVHSRFADARSLKAYAGSAPVTRASGKRAIVMHRRVKNQRLATTGYQWAFSALTASPGARTHYQCRRQASDAHTAALRHTFNRLLGCLHHCLQTRQPYNETAAFTPRPLAAA